MRMRRWEAGAVAVAAVLLGCGDNGARAGSGSAGTSGGTDDGGSDSGGVDPGVFGEERQFELRLNEDEAPPLALEMNREEVAQLFGDRADEVLLLELDTTELLTDVLEEVINACGTAWQLNNSDPNHDCSQTALGQTFMGPDGTWQTSAEYSMIRLLTMTPANVVVDGTSSEALQDVADFLGIGGGYSQILSEALGIPRTSPVVSTDSLVAAFRDNFVASHPEIVGGGKMRFTLEDALSDLATMTERYGPQGDHPGVIDPSFEVHGEVFGPDFQMRAVADSNLRLVDGIDGDQGKGFMSVIVDQTGPTFEDELEFDFTDPERFELTGIVEDLAVDLRFRLQEHDEFVDSCLGDPPCQQNTPDNPIDANSVWALDPWTIEYNIAAAARNEYIDRVFEGSWLLGAAKILIGKNGDPPGWIVYDIPIDLGLSPEDQWIWETVLEVGQVALHETPYSSFAEGTTDVAFTVRDVRVGLTGSEAAEAVRPFLQEQSALLSDFLLGDFKKNNDHVDFYYARAADGEPYLYFVLPDELRDGEPYTYARPGFFDSSTLGADDKISETVIPGLVDTTHEKLHIPVGETVAYYEDDGGLVYRIRVERADGTTDATISIAQRID